MGEKVSGTGMKRRHFRNGLAVLGCLLAMSGLPAQAAEENAPALLWRTGSSDPMQDQPLPTKKAWMIREREIVFDPQLLAVLKNASARPHPPILIDLFQDRPYELEVTSTVTRLSDVSTIKGTVKNTAKAAWSMVVTGNLVIGTFQIADRLYKIEHVQNGRHRLAEIDPKKMPPD